jgi:hypothetical protein
VAEHPSVRASDADRERAAAEIREHFAQGRLQQDELTERLGQAYTAQTTAELAALRADLPALPPSPVVRRTEMAERRGELTRQLVQETGAATAPFLVAVVIWLVSGADANFWPVWLLLIPVIFVVKNGWRLYGPAPDLDEVAKELHRRRGRGGRRHRP